ncbi:MAG: stage II sporulation protein M [Candidatus Pacearchaeota archaeon]|nr:stage II sporulation protein M [Candidatus Pacearchaeota archaeon]
MKRKKRKKFSIIEEYKKSWDYIKKSKNFIYIAIGIFLLFLLIGFLIPAPKILADELLKFVRDLLNQTEGLSQFELIQFIISNNVKTTFLSIFFGAIFGIFPIINTIINGYVLGFVFVLTVNNSGVWELWRILPHGIFELPAVFISFGLGIKLGMFIFQKKKLEFFKDYFMNSLRVFLLIILPLLIIAGIIEGILISLIA